MRLCACVFERVSVLSTCGHIRGNRAPCAERAISASLRHPASARFAVRPSASGDILGIHEYAVGSQSCINRLVLLRCARLRLGTRFARLDSL